MCQSPIVIGNVIISTYFETPITKLPISDHRLVVIGRKAQPPTAAMVVSRRLCHDVMIAAEQARRVDDGRQVVGGGWRRAGRGGVGAGGRAARWGELQLRKLVVVLLELLGLLRGCVMPFKSLKSIILQIAFGIVIDFFLNVILLKKCDLTLIEINVMCEVPIYFKKTKKNITKKKFPKKKFKK